MTTKAATSQPFDDTVKTFYRRFFEQRQMRAISQLEVFSRSRSIDLTIECTPADCERLQHTIFAHFRHLNALELKGNHDPLTLLDYNRIMMRSWGVGAIRLSNENSDEAEETVDESDEEDRYIFPDQRTVTMVCVTRPNKILSEYKDRLRFLSTELPGIYHCAERLPQWLIHPTELTLTPANYPLLPLARGEKLAQFIDVCLRDGLVAYLQLILDVGMTTDPYVIWQKIMEVQRMKTMIREETWPLIDQFLRETPEAMGKLRTIQAVLEESKQQGMLLNQQDTLQHILRHKFGAIPDNIIQTIQMTDNLARLQQWLDQALDAARLADINFTAAK